MGTRSLTHVKEDVWEFEGPEGTTPSGGKTLVTIYRQMDGYPAGMGKDLAEFLSGRTIVNGFGTGTPEKASNGMGCLAASLVGALKGNDIGGIYLYPPDSSDCGEEYVYTISNLATRRGSALNLKVESVYTPAVLYDGPPEDFSPEEAEKVHEEAYTAANPEG